ncbi:MAG: prolipoprotein diacylglyceryl transferase [Pelagibacteraceae bacterium]
MFINNFDPVAFQFFSFEIRWYSLAYIVGILIGWFLSKKIFISDNQIKEKFDDYITYLILGIIIGGRLGYVFIYNFDYYLNNPIEIIKIWQGGMSFHGAVLGIIISSLLFGKINNHNSFYYMDIVAIVAPIGIFFGRVANFLNSELYGNTTNVPWSVKFIQIDNFNRHPSQLYEAFFEGIVLFLILLYFYKKNYLRIPGKISGFFLFLYSTFRFILEFFRAPDNQLGYLIFGLTMGQIISVVFFTIGLVLILFKNEIIRTR